MLLHLVVCVNIDVYHLKGLLPVRIDDLNRLAQKRPCLSNVSLYHLAKPDCTLRMNSDMLNNRFIKLIHFSSVQLSICFSVFGCKISARFFKAAIVTSLKGKNLMFK